MQQISRDEFVQRMEIHLKTHFAPLFGNFTPAQLREFVTRNWQNATDYGLTSELAVCGYLEAASCLGEDFPNTRAWAKPLLEQECKESGKLECLNQKVLMETHPAKQT